MRCPICNIGKMLVKEVKPAIAGGYTTNAELQETDVVRLRRCEWCELSLVSVERIDRLIDPPRADRKRYDKNRTVHQTREEILALPEDGPLPAP